MKKVLFSFTALFLITFFSNTIAQIPRLINYQGMLMGNNSQPVPNGNYDLTFKLYDESSTVIWTEVHNQTAVSNGLFQVILGTITPFGIPFDNPYTLGIQVGSDAELQPRTPLTSVAYSIRAEDADKLMGIYASPTPEPNKLLPLDASGKFPSSVLQLSGGIDGNGTINYLPLFTGTTTLGNSIIFQTDGKLGLGTTTPTVKLELAGGDAKIYGLTIGRGSGSVATNQAFGYQSLNSNTTGLDNIAIGHQSLYSNTTGNSNTAVGRSSLYSNTTGRNNTAVGSGALYRKTGNNNTALGWGTLYSSSSDSNNTAIGYRAMYFANGGDNIAVGSYTLQGSYNPSNNTGSANTAVGDLALTSNTTGAINTATGLGSLRSNTTGSENSAFGFNSLSQNTDGNYNTAIGHYAGSNITTGSNNIAIGNNAQIPSASADNQVRIGNADITYAGIQVAWTVTSDKRLKDDIQPLNSGLDFMSKLHPVSYNRKNDVNHKTEYGFIAQEVEDVLKKQGVQNSGMLTIDDKGYYELRYNDLFAPMVKAIQELKNENELLKKDNVLLKNEINSLRTLITEQVKMEVSKVILKVGETNKTRSQFTLNKTEK
jgi:hypothetical protein